MAPVKTRIPEVVTQFEADLLSDWMQEQLKSGVRRDLINETELHAESQAFLRGFRKATSSGAVQDINAPEWGEVRDLLDRLSRVRTERGFTPSETATFVFSFKLPLFARLRKLHAANADGLADDVWLATQLLDRLGLFTTEIFQKARAAIINRQQQELMELSTPVVELWKGILALPLIGTLDSHRTQTVMESLLQRIVETGSDVAIIDITGVPTVDTLTAQHLLKTVTATRLMGADCIISGIRPQIAQTIVHLGVDLGDVTTKATLASAFLQALQRSGLAVTRVGAPAAAVKAANGQKA